MKAKKVLFQQVRECTNDKCSCCTTEGYYINYKNGKTQSILFVCEHCFDTIYKSKCTIGNFDENIHLNRDEKRQNLSIKKVGNFKVVRIVYTILILILLAIFLIYNPPKLRDELRIQKVDFDIPVSKIDDIWTQTEKIFNDLGG